MTGPGNSGSIIPAKYFVPVAIVIGLIALIGAFGLDRQTKGIVEREAARVCGGEDRVAEITAADFTCKRSDEDE